jgi:hypothetical protein
MNDNNEIWSMTLNMVIAAYLHKDPDTQVRRMAKRYKKSTNDKTTKKNFKSYNKKLPTF